MPVSWVVVADSCNARFFTRKKQSEPLQEVADLVNPSARMKPSDLESDSPGRSYDSFGKGRHAMEPKTSQKTRNAELFAKQISDFLTLHHEKFDSLIIISAPGFLGKLRKQLDKTILTKLTGEIKKDIVHADIDSISRIAYGTKNEVRKV
jgi:protein required for attachment to host cells